MAINKEIDLRFVVNYWPPEFRDATFRRRQDDLSARITGTFTLKRRAAFDALAEADAHAKAVIDPPTRSIRLSRRHERSSSP